MLYPKLTDSIKKLEIEKSLLEVLKDNGILYVNQLWELKYSDLRDMGLSSPEIRHIKIKLQLCSLDLNKRRYNPN